MGVLIWLEKVRRRNREVHFAKVASGRIPLQVERPPPVPPGVLRVEVASHLSAGAAVPGLYNLKITPVPGSNRPNPFEVECLDMGEVREILAYYRDEAQSLGASFAARNYTHESNGLFGIRQKDLEAL